MSFEDDCRAASEIMRSAKPCDNELHFNFEERWGNLTVAEVLELNKKAEETCAWEIVA